MHWLLWKPCFHKRGVSAKFEYLVFLDEELLVVFLAYLILVVVYLIFGLAYLILVVWLVVWFAVIIIIVCYVFFGFGTWFVGVLVVMFCLISVIVCYGGVGCFIVLGWVCVGIMSVEL